MQDINLAVCGHVDHGKSTLLGKTLVELKMVTSKKLEEALRTSDQSYVFANLMYRSKGTNPESEAKRGMTQQPSLIRFGFTERKLRVTCIDTPGHTQYTNNLFAGLFQADVALVLVAASEGVLASTLQVLKILRGFQIPVVGVSVTKMDLVDYSEEVYLNRVKEMKQCLQHFGLYRDSIKFFPTSAYAPGRDIRAPAEGIIKYEKIDWFKDLTFHQFMGQLDVNKERKNHSFRGLVHPNDMYDHVPGIGKAMTCVVEYGQISKQDKFVIEPASTIHNRPVIGRAVNLELTRGHMATPGIEIQTGEPRQLIGINVDLGSEKGSLRNICAGRGVVIGLESDPPATATDMILEMTVFDEKLKVRKDEVWTMHVHVDRVPIKILDILQYSVGTKQEDKDRPVNTNATEEPSAETDKQATAAAPADPTGQTPLYTDDALRSAKVAKSSGKDQVDLDEQTVWWTPDENTELEASDWVRLHVRAQNPVAIEESSKLPELSRFVVRQKLEASGYGFCLKILKKGECPRKFLGLDKEAAADSENGKAGLTGPRSKQGPRQKNPNVKAHSATD